MTRVDCLTTRYAWEVDFASKWSEAIGQALYYAAETDRLPGILLIIEKESDCKYIGRIQEVQRVWNAPIRIELTGEASGTCDIY